MAVVTKVTPKGVTTKIEKKTAPKEVGESNIEKKTKGAPRATERTDEEDSKRMGEKPKKFCHFCVTKTEPHFFDAAALRRYSSDRGRIFPRARSGACARHQRRITKEVKYARHLALLPFTLRA